MSGSLEEIIRACKVAKFTPDEIGRTIASLISAKSNMHVDKPSICDSCSAKSMEKSAIGGAGTDSTSCSDAEKLHTIDQTKIAYDAIKGIFEKANTLTDLKKLAITCSDGKIYRIIYIKTLEKDHDHKHLNLFIDNKMIDIIKDELLISSDTLINAMHKELESHIKEHAEDFLVDLKSKWKSSYVESKIETATSLKLIRRKTLMWIELI